MSPDDLLAAPDAGERQFAYKETNGDKRPATILKYAPSYVALKSTRRNKPTYVRIDIFARLVSHVYKAPAAAEVKG